ncbi:hypothetical protein NEUTE2DRAFT_124867 [Neurospora tetrasperma FGSC 2509]|nr:hypothetical protein NEUTE2DRAFT_124867 [Neurospora tetrasperma FGSC 2509]
MGPLRETHLSSKPGRTPLDTPDPRLGGTAGDGTREVHLRRDNMAEGISDEKIQEVRLPSKPRRPSVSV